MSMCNWKLIVSCIGLAIFIVGCVLGWAVFPNLIRDQIKEVRKIFLDLCVTY